MLNVKILRSSDASLLFLLYAVFLLYLFTHNCTGLVHAHCFKLFIFASRFIRELEFCTSFCVVKCKSRHQKGKGPTCV